MILRGLIGILICISGNAYADSSFLFTDEDYDVSELLDDIPVIRTESDIQTLSSIPVIGNEAAGFVSRSDSLNLTPYFLYNPDHPMRDIILNQLLPISGIKGPVGLSYRTGIQYNPGNDLADGSRYYSKIRLISGDDLTGSAILERDPGEKRAVDLASGNLTFHSGGIRLTAGDYRPGIGQGLVFSRYGRSYVSGVDTMQREPVSVANSSFEESNYLRGVHAELKQQSWYAKGWFSSRRRDATLDQNGHAVTIRETGYHLSGVAKDNLRESIGGAAIGITWFEGMDIAMAATVSEYDPELAGVNGERGFFDPQGSVFRHLILSGSLEKRSIRLFAEVASMDIKNRAVIGGVNLKGGPVKAAVMVRRYDDGYWAPRSGAFSSFGSTSNEEGVYSALEANIPGGVNVLSAIDLARTINRTYLSAMPFARRRFQMTAGKRFHGGMTVRMLFRSTVSNSDSYTDRASISIQAGNRPLRNGAGWRVILANSAGSGDSGHYMEYALIFRRGMFECETAAGLFDIPSYSARYYHYERDVPGRGMSRPVWGRGGVALFLVRAGGFSMRAVWRDSDLMSLSREVTVQYDASFPN